MLERRSALIVGIAAVGTIRRAKAPSITGWRPPSAAGSGFTSPTDRDPPSHSNATSPISPRGWLCGETHPKSSVGVTLARDSGDDPVPRARRILGQRFRSHGSNPATLFTRQDNQERFPPRGFWPPTGVGDYSGCIDRIAESADKWDRKGQFVLEHSTGFPKSNYERAWWKNFLGLAFCLKCSFALRR